ncbi:Short-chain dehydrogenase/reductase SDR [Penicillium cf. griseofulvum]|uniref:Short-chain dehydrogenase/reductase SDR n=1 Tax=Penicillium cf. griseofulvum TaxID=2972120 RepID=A0A9W9N0C5_9EURO|nr:Short-chain dehydrogenase/reductase SDR [Penicillium cf. griseofulvum]
MSSAEGGLEAPRAPTTEEVDTIFRPYRSDQLRWHAMTMFHDHISPALPRTHYSADEEERARHDKLLTDLIDPRDSEEWSAVLDNKDLFNFGSDWRRVYDVLPEIAGPLNSFVDDRFRIVRTTTDEHLESSRSLCKTQLAEAKENDPEVWRADRIAFIDGYMNELQNYITQTYLIIADEEAFRSGSPQVVYLDGFRNIIREVCIDPEIDDIDNVILEGTLQTPGIAEVSQPSPAPAYRIEIFTQSELMKQTFLPELWDVINVSYLDTGDSSIEKTGPRIRSNTQLADELQETGITAIAFAQNSIIGTASLKVWSPDSEGALWKSPGHFEHFCADEIFTANSTVLDSLHGESQDVSCKGGFEIVAVAITPDPRYRRKGIAESLVKACEKELKGGMTSAGLTESAQPCIMVKCIREIQGAYWLKRGFRVVGEQYCPPLTWRYNKGFVLWAMERELPV